MTKNAQLIEQQSGSSEGYSALNVKIVPDLSDDNKVFVNPEITQLTCDIYYELQRARNKYSAKKNELNVRGTTMTHQEKTKLERLEKRIQEWQDLLNDALKPEFH